MKLTASRQLIRERNRLQRIRSQQLLDYLQSSAFCAISKAALGFPSILAFSLRSFGRSNMTIAVIIGDRAMIDRNGNSIFRFPIDQLIDVVTETAGSRCH